VIDSGPAKDGVRAQGQPFHTGHDRRRGRGVPVVLTRLDGGDAVPRAGSYGANLVEWTWTAAGSLDGARGTGE